ncbi:MAG: hypothetical protein ACI841_002340, partial [Planctomycetota bacterium]
MNLMYSRWPDVKLVGCHADHQSAMAAAALEKVDIVLLDFRRM